MAAMPFAPPPASAAWGHREGRGGFDVLRARRSDGGWTLRGTTTALEEGTAWVVEYALDVAGWSRRTSTRFLDARPDVESEFSDAQMTEEKETAWTDFSADLLARHQAERTGPADELEAECADATVRSRAPGARPVLAAT